MNNNSAITKYMLIACLLISSISYRIHSDEFTRSVTKILIITGIVAGIFYSYQTKDTREDEQMVTNAHKLLEQTHQEYDYLFDLLQQDPKNLTLSNDNKEQLLNTIPNVISTLSDQENVLNNRLIRARTSIFIRQNAAMMKKVEVTQKEIQELTKYLRSLLHSSCFSF